MVVVLGSVSLASAESWRFAVLCDTRGSEDGINKPIVESMARALAREKVDFVLVPGDLAEGVVFGMGKRLEAWRQLMAPLYKAGVKVYPIRGNHEAVASRDTFRDVFPELPQNGPDGEKGITYSFTHRNAVVVGLDQYVRSNRINQKWLDQVLAANKQPHVFVFSHESAFAAYHPGTLARRPKDRDVFWNSLGAAGAKLYFCGHDHFYARAAIPDAAGRVIQQIIIGSGGAPSAGFGNYRDPRVQPLYYDNQRYGYLIVEVDDQKVSVEWKAQGYTRGMPAFAAADRFGYDMTSGLARATSSQPAPVALRPRPVSPDRPTYEDSAQTVR